MVKHHRNGTNRLCLILFFGFRPIDCPFVSFRVQVVDDSWLKSSKFNSLWHIATLQTFTLNMATHIDIIQVSKSDHIYLYKACHSIWTLKCRQSFCNNSCSFKRWVCGDDMSAPVQHLRPRQNLMSQAWSPSTFGIESCREKILVAQSRRMLVFVWIPIGIVQEINHCFLCWMQKPKVFVVKKLLLVPDYITEIFLGDFETMSLKRSWPAT